MPQFFKTFVIVVSVLTGACASLGKPDPLLPNAAFRCSNQPTTEAKDACNVGVLAERDRTIAAAKASQPTYGSGYGNSMVYGGNGYAGNGYVSNNNRPQGNHPMTFGSRGNIAPSRETVGGTVNQRPTSTPAPTPTPQKPGAPGVK